MSTPREVALASIEGAIARDPDRIVERAHPEVYADDIVAVGEFRGREAVRGFFAELFAAVPDYDMEVEQVIADGNAVTVRWRARGTFDGGPFQGFRPSGRPIDIRGVDVFEIDGEHIVRNTVYYDGAAFARQIGLLPREGSFADRAAVRLFNGRARLRRLGRRPGRTPTPGDAGTRERRAGADAEAA
jgi:steroid delta-isomerase-like uncharacterized protein